MTHEKNRGPKRAVIYCRISRDPNGQQLGVRRQEADTRALCEREGFDVAGVFVDDDRSAYSGKPRPAYKAMKEAVASGDVDVVVAWHPDRITRHPRELEDLIDLLESTSTTVRTCQTGPVDLATAAGRMAARIVGAVARHESEHKSARLRRKHLELAEAGAISGGGGRGYGYEIDKMTVREDEAEVVREMARRLLAGESVRSICRDLNDRGLTTTSGRTWYPGALTRLLASPRIAGLREHHGKTTTAVWPGIIEADDHCRLKAILADPARRKHSGGRERRLLTGLLVCGLCGAKMLSRPNGRGAPCYVCATGPGYVGCGGIRIIGEPLDDMVTEAVLDSLDSSAMTVALAPAADDRKTLEALAALDDRTGELAEMWALGDIGKAEWAAANQALTNRRAALESELRDTAVRVREPVSTQNLRDRWPTLSHERRRAALANVVSSITVGPGVRGRNFFDADRVTMTWCA